MGFFRCCYCCWTVSHFARDLPCSCWLVSNANKLYYIQVCYTHIVLQYSTVHTFKTNSSAKIVQNISFSALNANERERKKKPYI